MLHDCPRKGSPAYEFQVSKYGKTLLTTGGLIREKYRNEKGEWKTRRVHVGTMRCTVCGNVVT